MELGSAEGVRRCLEQVCNVDPHWISTAYFLGAELDASWLSWVLFLGRAGGRIFDEGVNFISKIFFPVEK